MTRKIDNIQVGMHPNDSGNILGPSISIRGNIERSQLTFLLS